VNDKTIPTLTLPAPMTLDASGPSGAVATFTATAIDAAPTNPAVSCLPASGSTFAFGTSAVVCRATDAAGNEAVGQFNVTVQGPTQQLASLSARIQAMAMDAKLKEKLLKLLGGVTSVLPKSRPAACGQLSDFLAVATDALRKGLLTAQQLNEIAVQVTQIKAVIGC
jgi:HYR domain